MLNVRKRRWLAVTIIVAFTAVSLLWVFLALAKYSPDSLTRRAAAAVKEAAGADATIDAGTVSVDGRFTSASAQVAGGDGAPIIAAKGITVTGLPEGPRIWRPTKIAISSVELSVDPSNPAIGLAAVRMADRALDRADGIAVELPYMATVSVAYGGAAKAFQAPTGAFLAKRVIELPTPPTNDPTPWTFTITPTEAVMSASVDAERLAMTVAQAAGKGLLDRAENYDQGQFIVRWNADGETAAFVNKRGWKVPAEAVKSLGAKVEGDGDTVSVVSFTSKNGKIEDIVLAPPAANP